MARIISPSGKGGSGAPSGVYANIVALEAAYPVGNKNVYVTLADGNWNYWNGTAWAAGGVYLSDPTVVNNLTDGGVDVPLSAEMGKELDEKKLDVGANSDLIEPGDINKYYPDSVAHLIEDIKGTTQTVAFNPDGTVASVTHKNASNVTVRTDVFTYATNLITEVRTLSTAETITFKYHTDTLITEVI